MKYEECEIPLKDNWFIKSDPYQYICVQRKKIEKGKNKGEWKWDSKNATYYRTIPHLLDEWGKKMVRMGGYKSIGELIDGTRRVESILDEIARKCSFILGAK